MASSQEMPGNKYFHIFSGSLWGFFSVVVKSTCKTALKWHFAKGSKLQFGWEKGELKQRSVLGEVRFYVLHQCLHAGLQKGSVLWKTRHLDSSIEA